MRIAVVSNYPPDRQQSMLRFGAVLAQELAARGTVVRSIAPQPVLLRLLRAGDGGIAKWIKYADKYILFPRRLRRHLADMTATPDALVHLVDHSNAVYIPARSRVPWIVTCHDLLAVRGALGEDTDCPASSLGRRLQAAIVTGLSRAHAIGTDSTSTMNDVERIVPAARSQLRRRILLGLNHPFGTVDAPVALRRLKAIGGVPWEQDYILHVGSNLARKNKPGIVRVFAHIAERWPGNLIFCGAALPPEIRAQAAAAGVSARVFAVPDLDNSQLEAAYNRAHALLFPSRCEGFGWPVIEAQACGCPVVCSDRTSLPEVGGPAALVHDLNDEAGMGGSLLAMTDPSRRAAVVSAGLVNLRRFTTARMIDDYLALYEGVLASSP